jgi:hypothetical protein
MTSGENLQLERHLRHAANHECLSGHSRCSKSPGTMILAALVLAALSLGAEVFPEPLCENLPEVSPEVKTWVAQVAPELAQVPVRELSETTALDVFRRAAASGWGSIDVLTHAVFRKPCTFHFSREALRAVDAAFDLRLLPPLRGQDRKGQDFEMADILAGRGKLVVFYDRDGIVYRNETLNRDFTLASRIEFDTPVAGVLDNIHGLCAKVFLFGCVRVRSMVKTGETVEVRAGAFTSNPPLRPIQDRGKGRSRPGKEDIRRDQPEIAGAGCGGAGSETGVSAERPRGGVAEHDSQITVDEILTAVNGCG